MNYGRYSLCLAALMIAPPVVAECTATKIADLPVTMEGLKPIVPATLNGTAVRFIADSGAFYSLISPSVAAQLKLPLSPTPANFLMRGIGGVATTSVTKVKAFGIAGSTVPDVTFLVGGSDTGRAGLLGQNVLGLFDTDFDLAAGMIRLIRTKDCGRTNLAYWAGSKPVQTLPLIPVDARNPHVMAYVMVNGVKMRAVFDTGAPTSMLTTKAAARAGVTPADPLARSIGIAAGLGRDVARSWTAPFKSFAFADEQIQNIRLRIAELPDVPFDMLIGVDFFLSHHVFVSKSTGRMFLTYNGGPVFAIRGDSPAAEAGQSPTAQVAQAATADASHPSVGEPSDADGFARRGAAFAARRDFASAFSDFGRAIALAPSEARYLVARASAFAANRQPLLAKTDLDAAIRLQPDSVDARTSRALLYLATGHRAEALVDIDAASRAAPREADIRLVLASLYSRAEAQDRAIGQYDLWLTIHPRDDNRQPQAMNGRCWARALLGRELDKALNDCNAALRLAPRTAGFLDSRGLVRLRMGELDKAITDYDAALAIEPATAWSLYGRGLARLRKGMNTQGDADIAAALVLSPGLAEQAQRYGILDHAT